jgi:hypothetical protein
MIRVLVGVFLAFHSLVHLLYAGQSGRYFELQKGMVWPDGSWAFSRLLGDAMIRNLASIFLALAALGFMVSGVGIFAKQGWWRPASVVAAVLSTAIFVLFWDGKFQHLDTNGGVGILIDLVILAAVLIFHWPRVDF